MSFPNGALLGRGAALLFHQRCHRSVVTTTLTTVINPHATPMATITNHHLPSAPQRYPSSPLPRYFASKTTAKNDTGGVVITKSSSSSSSSNEETNQTPSNSCGPDPEALAADESIRTLQNTIRTHYHSADYPSALTSSNELLTLCHDHFGRNHPVTASAHNNVGLMNKMLGHFSDSRSHYRKALDIYGEVVGNDHASYAAALNNLGNLERFQSQMDEELGVEERRVMMDGAIGYFEEALSIRKEELGEDHPQTVTSRGNLGGALAFRLLFQQQLQQEEQERRQGANDKSSSSPTSTVTALTIDEWTVAEDHLRSALLTTIKHPHGQKIKNRKSTSIHTLTAAAAAQNLAVFLKCRAQSKKITDGDAYAEAKTLYHGALLVRSEILGEGHPDTIATKASLAELLEVMGDARGANDLRREVLEAYEVEEREEENGGGGGKEMR